MIIQNDIHFDIVYIYYQKFVRMKQEIQLIRRKFHNNSYEYQICKEGLHFLRSMNNKKFRIIFNITHHKQSLSSFNRGILNKQNISQIQSIQSTICLTISKHYKNIQQQRVIIIFNSYQQSVQLPLMPLIGYLASSLFIYHNNNHQISESSCLTKMLVQLKELLSNTDLHILNQQIKEKKGYAKQPYFLCILQEKNQSTSQFDRFKQFYKYDKQKSENLNQAVDTLIDFFPERSSIILQQKKLTQIGKQFQQKLLGREIFNFQFTGSTIQNLCFQCCEIFNRKQNLNLVQIYHKIIENQKARLIDIAKEQYLKELSIQFYRGNKISYSQCLSFPMTTSDLLNKHNIIADKIIENAIQSATNCMNLIQYKQMYYELKDTFKKQLQLLMETNNLKADQLCGQCFCILENIDQIQLVTSQSINHQFNQIINKLQLYSSQCSQILGNDPILQSYNSHLKRLQFKLLQSIQNTTKNGYEKLQYQIQEDKVEIQELKYSLKVNQNKFRKLQNQYNIQLQILQTYKIKLLSQPQNNTHNYSGTYTLEVNKMRKKIQELQEEVKDNNLHIEELSSVIQKFEGLTQKQKQKFKFKFSKQIQQTIQQVLSKVKICYDVIKQARQTNEIYEQIKNSFGKEKEKIQLQKRKSMDEITNLDAQLKRLIKEKTILQQTINQSKQSINNLKNTMSQYQKSIDQLQNTYTQTLCHLAQTQSDLQSFKKALSLLNEQKIKGKSQNLNKFYKVSHISELKQLLGPFLKK